ncbi:MAG: hypothetical protein HKO66_07970, partial [Saprospiraceae bacterium]|nr:hypothetical protein [Bacteroidia bacterium]NNL92153.1 hypothetical protein [Saprospiraceae bacterium]
RVYFAMGEKATAKEFLDIAIQLDNNQPDAHYYLGKYYDDKNETQSAYDHFLQAEKLGCKEHGLEFYLANLDSDLKNKS